MYEVVFIVCREFILRVHLHSFYSGKTFLSQGDCSSLTVRRAAHAAAAASALHHGCSCSHCYSRRPCPLGTRVMAGSATLSDKDLFPYSSSDARTFIVRD